MSDPEDGTFVDAVRDLLISIFGLEDDEEQDGEE